MPEFEEETSQPEPTRKMSASTFKSSKPPPSLASRRTAIKTVDEALAGDPAGSEDSASVTEDSSRIFTGGKIPPTMEKIKGILLSTAEQSLAGLCETITEQGGNDLAASELELVVVCKLELAAIARQRHLSKTSTDIVVTAMKLIEDSPVFEEMRESQMRTRPSSMRGTRNKTEPPSLVTITQPNKSSQYQYQNFQSRSRLDARLWLDCRLALVKGLMGEIKGMGQIGGRSVDLQIPDARQYCVDGLSEAEACGDIEMQAEFLMLGASIDLQEGRELDDVKQVLMEVVEMLKHLQTISTLGQFLLGTAVSQLTDLEMLSARAYEQEKGEPMTKQALNNYSLAQNIMLKQLMLLGETIEHKAASPYYSSPVSPLLNIYHPHVLYLAKIKLRIGYTLAREATRVQAKLLKKNLGEKSADVWIECAAVLGTALELCRVCTRREPSLEAEILLNLGKVQRQLFECGSYQPRHVASTLLEAINISYNSNHDLGLIRQAYLEIALVYLSARPQTSESTLAVEDVELPRKKTATPSKASRGSTKASVRSQKSQRDVVREKNRERIAAWTAIRAATAAAVAQRTRSLMIGDPQLTSLRLKSKVRESVPEFLVMDLLGGISENPSQTVKREPHPKGLEPVEEVHQASETDSVESGEDDVIKALRAGSDITWIHLLGYSSILQRLCNTSTLGIAADTLQNGGAVSLGTGFELGYYSSGKDACTNHDIIRLPLMCGNMALRQTILHQFLATNLSLYASDCVAITPPSALQLKPQGSATELNIPVIKYEENMYIPQEIEDEDLPAAASTQASVPSSPKKKVVSDAIMAKETLEKSVISSAENEISIQWYQPSFESGPASVMNGVLFIFALNKQEKRQKSSATSQPPPITNTGKMWLTFPELAELHDKLAVVRQKAEISLAEQPKPPSTPQTPTSGKPSSRKSKRTTRITQLSAKVKRDENLEALLKQCISDIYTLLEYKSDEQLSEEIPFPVILANIHNLEQLFDPSNGDWMKNNSDVFKWLTSVLQ
ncbi:cilia- and flagella-associated protein 54-like [Saccoglossus kowalevskii]